MVFLFSLLLRIYFFCGFVLGDDREEIGAVLGIMQHGPDFSYHLHYRFGLWLFNFLCFRLLGVSEFSFFLPTVLMSASLSIFGYGLLKLWRFETTDALAGGLLIASAPFEVLIGTVRANDLIFAWFLALALFSFFVLQRKPVYQGLALALFWWLAFYVKLWVVYLFPALALYYIVQFVRTKTARGLLSFSCSTWFLHSLSGVYWKLKLGSFLPFIEIHAATYPVDQKDLADLFQIYPHMLFKGSEFETTFFGAVPYLLIALIGVKSLGWVASKKKAKSLRWDVVDVCLFGYYICFFLFLNFFPNSFRFDQYYSAPRIFRYLTPLSFPMTLHAAKMLLELGKILRGNFRHLSTVLMAFFVAVFIYQSAEATSPGRTYREKLLLLVTDLKEAPPPQLLAERWIAHFLQVIYLVHTKIQILPQKELYQAAEYERWLNATQPKLQTGAMMISGLNSYVYYGCSGCGFRLLQFKQDLDPHWHLFKDYGRFDFSPLPEPVRLWRFSDVPRVRPLSTTEGRGIYEKGLKAFHAGEFDQAQEALERFVRLYSRVDLDDSAMYFLGISKLRLGNVSKAFDVFQQAARKFPQSRWQADYLYHMAICAQQLGQEEKAIDYLDTLVSRYPQHWLASHAAALRERMAKEELNR